MKELSSVSDKNVELAEEFENLKKRYKQVENESDENRLLVRQLKKQLKDYEDKISFYKEYRPEESEIKPKEPIENEEVVNTRKTETDKEIISSIEEIYNSNLKNEPNKK
jgi:hypothetical protein